jgi:hypothetical protein
MKKLVAIFFAGMFLTASLSSCKKCYVCDFDGEQRELCSKDLPDGTKGLKLTIQGYEDRGYTCTEKE